MASFMHLAAMTSHKLPSHKLPVGSQTCGPVGCSSSRGHTFLSPCRAACTAWRALSHHSYSMR